MRKVLGALLICVFLFWAGIRTYKAVSFSMDCGGYLKRAADANTVELAKQELKTALSYLQSNHLTAGYTSVWYRTQDEDIGWWHKNLIASLEELEKVGAGATQLEKANILMKLRETLLDHGKNGDSVTIPDGISVFPDNKGFAIWGCVGLILAIVGFLLIISDDDF